jgi:hypothetical protein
MSQKRIPDEKKTIKPKTEKEGGAKERPIENDVSNLQNLVGNRAVQRLLSQRSEDGSFELDEDTSTRIKKERGSGEALGDHSRVQMESTLGHDFSNVRVHNSAESDEINQQLNAKAFTTGQDIFFKDGAYNPDTTSGQQLIAHELTHVVQQETGAVNSGGDGMVVNAPGDSFEQEADAVSQSVESHQVASDVQRQEEEEEVQMQEEEELQMQEEEELQMQEEEEEVQMQEEEELQMQSLEEEEEELQMQPLEEEEEELMP